MPTPPTAPAVPVAGGTLTLMNRPKFTALPAMRADGVTHLVTVLGRREGALTLRNAARAAGLQWIWVELANGNPPPAARDRELIPVVRDLAGVLRDGGNVVVHCSAGIHRTGMVAYALLRAGGMRTDRARETLGRLRTVALDGVGEHRLAWAEGLCARAGWA
ncbi:tyrosine-protein phosphatase [Streptomyces sp. NPDC048483]|uniref:protein-tyrosine phosphatase family protein n=1 Tax=Streptomyces sp. NPDC048483 TaxID=3154927 RepID=UPI003446D924